LIAIVPKNGVVLDPFAGSAIAAFEAVKLGRNVVAFDLNPLTSFIIEVLSSPFDEVKFVSGFERIFEIIENDPLYVEHYIRDHKGEKAIVSNYRWLDGEVDKVAYEVVMPRTKKGKKTKTKRYIVNADLEDKQRVNTLGSLEIPFWHPTRSFPDTPTIKHKFVKDIGGNGFQHLWTNRNLYLLSRIFDEILKEPDQALQLQLAFGFIQTLHLTSKMVVPRNPSAKRDFSGSWGRADYMIRRKSMEQNPLIVFRRSCIEKQGVISALRDAKLNLPEGLRISNAVAKNKIQKTAAINYGTIDVADIDRLLPAKSIDFVITDPPYAGLVQYLDLSLVWLVWLERIDSKYFPDLSAEITVKKGKISRDIYRKRLENAFRQLHRVLKDDGYIVITFHHKKIQEWNDFVKAVRLAGFKFDKVTHQYNRRSGESNVANPYGTSGADFYIRCVKQRDVDFSDDASGLRHFVVQKAIEIIASRNEPTPYDFIVAGLMPEMLQAGYMQPQEYKDEIHRVLSEHIGERGIFTIAKNTENKAGDYWWFSEPKQFISYPDRPLRDRVEESVISILRRKVSVKFDDVLGELFRTYPNGLTPDPRSIKSVIQKYATASAGKWKIKDSTVQLATQHTEIIHQILLIGKRSGASIFVGKREQPEITSTGVPLRRLADNIDLASLRLSYDAQRIERLEMIDCLWLSKGEITCVFEVENSTGFTSAIVRASNLDNTVPKFMVIPNGRELELLSITDPLFVQSFGDNNWRYLTYETLNRLSGLSTPSINEVWNISKKLK
jgi:16S rRNA G966 N2-methylase RsmD